MSQFLLGSLNLTELNAKLKSGEIKVFTSSKTGNKYIDVAVAVNDQPNQFGQTANLSHKNKDTGVTHYLANFKPYGHNQQGNNNGAAGDPAINADNLDFLN